MPHSAINCKRLVPKCAWSFWKNPHESEAAEDNCLWQWIETTTDLAKCTSRRTCKRNFSQDHASAVTEQKEDLILIHIQGMNSRKTFKILWIMTLDNVHGSHFHPHTSCRTCKRNFSQDHASAVTEQTKDLILIHIQGMDSRTTFKVLWIMTFKNVHWCN